MDRVGVGSEVDELPHLILAEHWEEGRGILEVGGDDPVTRGLLAFGEGDKRSGVVVRGDLEPADGELAGIALSSRSTRAMAALRGVQRLRRRRPVVPASSLGIVRRVAGPGVTRRRMTCG